MANSMRSEPRQSADAPSDCRMQGSALRAAADPFVDKILRGARPADIPIDSIDSVVAPRVVRTVPVDSNSTRTESFVAIGPDPASAR